MSKISADQVKHVAHLARIAVSNEEAEKMRDELEKITAFVEKLNEVNTDGVEPTSHVLNMKNVMREDVPTDGLPREKVLKNAPQHQDGQFRVPSILE
ncbi:Asp-tRNA(Asn)/Glu-tRNA(Gln) amidotransferase subunit GatC [Mesobacillus harenae]|uniref:Asp-tRNA(Asn)/Glu-tRNA(Gln) amidotransferase subunit GatC n=1 Tax=Mesobacillus harenae TaxID=2213203 RepID=UPI00157FE8F0|nr:Asp-tRNA(Asn)/Glu-tRNA(Gln) amidotransferase subunit GatC [Mesobacillus harenae]